MLHLVGHYPIVIHHHLLIIVMEVIPLQMEIHMWGNGKIINIMDKEFLFLKSGEKYEGEFKNGKRHGQGINTFENGEKYVTSMNLKDNLFQVEERALILFQVEINM